VGIGDAGGMNIYLATNAAHVNKLIG